jgi:hypothetical protein
VQKGDPLAAPDIHIGKGVFAAPVAIGKKQLQIFFPVVRGQAIKFDHFISLP